MNCKSASSVLRAQALSHKTERRQRDAFQILQDKLND